MEWKIADDRPIWMQLSEQIAAQIAAGVYSVGERLPSVRELAADAGVNPNTMQRAMADLEDVYKRQVRCRTWSRARALMPPSIR